MKTFENLKLNTTFSNKNLGRPQADKAFTLAEVLITLGIIGVIAALTIPTLMNNIQKNEYKAEWKKDYSVIAQAYEKVKQDEGGDLSSYFNSGLNYLGGNTEIADKMGKYLAYTEKCNIPNDGVYLNICNSNSTVDVTNFYKTLSGDYFAYYNLGHGQYVLKDGTNLYFRTWNTDGYFGIFVDVNGYKKGPNVFGEDLLGMLVSKDKVMPMGVAGFGVANTCNSTAVSCPDHTYGFHGGDCAGASCALDYLSN